MLGEISRLKFGTGSASAEHFLLFDVKHFHQNLVIFKFWWKWDLQSFRQRRNKSYLVNRKKACIFPLYNQMARLYPERFQEFLEAISLESIIIEFSFLTSLNM